jgi:transposase-like protein
MKTSANITALCKELGIERRLLYKWRDELQPADRIGEPPEHITEAELRRQVAQLKRLLADKTLEVDFFRGALQKVEARRQSSKTAGETASTTKSGN